MLEVHHYLLSLFAEKTGAFFIYRFNVDKFLILWSIKIFGSDKMIDNDKKNNK